MSKFLARQVRRKLEVFCYSYVFLILCFVPNLLWCCLKKCLQILKNPVVIVCLTIFGFIQTIVILASLSAMKHKPPPRKVTYFRVPQEFLRPVHVWDNSQAVQPSILNYSIPDINSSLTQLTQLPQTPPKRGRYVNYGSQDFRYPLLVDMLDLVDRLKNNLPVSVKPINDPKFGWRLKNQDRCVLTKKEIAAGFNSVYLLILVKSAPKNKVNRLAIRRSWGQANCWGGRPTRLIFLLGDSGADSVNRQLLLEHRMYNDLVIQNYKDHYHNNTYKIMSGFDWAKTCCGKATYILFVDDDYFVQPKNLLNYLDAISPSAYKRLFAGYVWPYAWPVRIRKGHKKKWFVALGEYPWASYPPYCAAGSFLVSGELIEDVGLAMRYTKYMRFDDVYLGLVLHKLLIVPMHMNEVYSFNPIYPKNKRAFGTMIASHGYKNSAMLEQAWKSTGASFCGTKVPVRRLPVHQTAARTPRTSRRPRKTTTRLKKLSVSTTPAARPPPLPTDNNGASASASHKHKDAQKNRRSRG